MDANTNNNETSISVAAKNEELLLTTNKKFAKDMRMKEITSKLFSPNPSLFFILWKGTE